MHDPKRKAQEQDSKRKARVQNLKRMAREHGPQRQAREHGPKRKARVHDPKRKAVEIAAEVAQARNTVAQRERFRAPIEWHAPKISRRPSRHELKP